ncbi:zona pellucida sperm-binding protein 3-like isoform X2 [Myripristis murdjan]|uniref:zona pellucida sperm-binding protein 3-like isoform X2 n=1 Tax=Myripristis murdjan TaxID=586833 RepID=UPI001175E3A8|nr:zona pellucida sperm-binding protein 3-like isoform X2 [Myripristis murdjan]
MGFSQLAAFVSLLACVRLSDARSLGLKMPTYWGVSAQKPAEVETGTVAEPERDHSRESAQLSGSFQSKQFQQSAQPLPWTFPEDPVSETKVPLKFELRQPVTANSVAVRCGESAVQVEVNQDLLGIGQLIKSEEITLGGCSATEIDDDAHVLIFKSELHECGSTVVMTENAFIYAFTLVYNPKVLGKTNIIRSRSAVIGIECHFPRRLSVSTSPPNPVWMSNKDTKVVEEQLSFSLQRMTDDWKSERPSNKYVLGDVLNVEASVVSNKYTPLRVLVDRCVATLKPDITSDPRHFLISNHGCLMDTRLTGSRSRFLAQSQPDKLQFQIETFRFRQQRTASFQQIYITCDLKALPASSSVTTEHKTCSFDKGWKAVGGEDQFCSCCESSCGMRKARRQNADTEEQWQATITLDPIVVEE